MGATAFLGRTLFGWLISRDLETRRAELEQEGVRAVERLRAELARDAEHTDHLYDEIRRWANPILDAVDGLLGRLRNLLYDEGWVALRPGGVPHPAWTITHDYLLPSTVYLFAQYFCWTQRLREELSFRLFESHEEKDAFFARQLEAARCLSEWPLPNADAPAGGDAQVFLLQQRRMGEALMADGPAGPRCLRYADFAVRWDQNGAFRTHFEPLSAFLEGLSPETTRWQRLTLMEERLAAVRAECRRILNVPG